MKRFIFVVISTMFFVAVIKNNGCHFSPSTEKIEPKTIQEKYTALQVFAVHLKQEGIISVHPEQFAKFMLCVFYAESGLKTTAVGGSGSLGINQLTAATRKRLDLPADISKDGFNEQLQYFKTYLVATRQGLKIKRVYDLHILNFSPYKIGQEYLCKANPAKNLHHLDKDKDGDITAKDMKMFIQKRCKENRFVYKKYLEVSI